MSDTKRNAGLITAILVVCMLLSGCQTTNWRQAGFTPGSLAPSQNGSGDTEIDLGLPSDSLSADDPPPQTYETQRPPSEQPQETPNTLEELSVPQARHLSIPPLRGAIILGRSTSVPFPEGKRSIPRPQSLAGEPTLPRGARELKPQPLPLTTAPDPKSLKEPSGEFSLGEPEEVLGTDEEQDAFDLPPLVSDDELRERLNLPQETDRKQDVTSDTNELGPSLPLIETPDIEAKISEEIPEFTVQLPETMWVGEVTSIEVFIKAPKGKNWQHLDLVLKLGEDLISAAEPQTDRLSIPLLKGGETRKVALEFQAVTSGTHELELALSDADRELQWKKLKLQAKPRILVTHLMGPEEKPLGGRAEYTLRLENVSTDAIGPIRAVLEFDGTLIPMEASAGAEQKPGQLIWSFPVLHPGEQILLQAEYQCPVATGSTCVSSHVTIDNGPEQSRRTCLSVIEPRGTLVVELLDRDDLTHVGRELTGVVRVTNRGLQAAKRVEIQFSYPKNLSLVQVQAKRDQQDLDIEQEGETGVAIVILKSPVPADQSVDVEFLFSADDAGDQKLMAQVKAEGIDKPVTASEPFTVTP
ncbi:MAG: hypothetical protein HUJ26_04090 [Planctomycetaceae bacterium]|nr:hypothetical protein [Planctomycetaceae bacterium]